LAPENANEEARNWASANLKVGEMARPRERHYLIAMRKSLSRISKLELFGSLCHHQPGMTSGESALLSAKVNRMQPGVLKPILW
jgi:hypothetical protein